MQDSRGSERSGANDDLPTRDSPGHGKWWHLLLLIPLIGLLYPPFYAHMHPTLGGVPFFIWYQFAWVFGGVATTVAVTRLAD